MIKINQVYLRDNLEFMKELPDEFLDLIYIDPPFFSQEDYKDFMDIWNDLDEYLDYMEIRLIEIYRVLKSNGSFYCHCDYHCSHYLKILLDQIFNIKNFRSDIVWNVNSISGFKSQKKGWIRSHDNILYYVKSSDDFTFYKKYIPYDKEYYKKFRYKDDKGKYALSNGRKIYLKERKGIPYSDVWNDIFSYQTITRDRNYTGYATQKPNRLLERIINSSSSPDDLIGDFFCGSGTTLAVAKKLRRKWIGCDDNPDAIEITKTRLANIKVFKDITNY